MVTQCSYTQQFTVRVPVRTSCCHISGFPDGFWFEHHLNEDSLNLASTSRSKEGSLKQVYLTQSPTGCVTDCRISRGRDTRNTRRGERTHTHTPHTRQPMCKMSECAPCDVGRHADGFDQHRSGVANSESLPCGSGPPPPTLTKVHTSSTAHTPARPYAVRMW